MSTYDDVRFYLIGLLQSPMSLGVSFCILGKNQCPVQYPLRMVLGILWNTGHFSYKQMVDCVSHMGHEFYLPY